MNTYKIKMKNKKLRSFCAFLIQFVILSSIILIFSHISALAKESLPITPEQITIYSKGNIPTPPEGKAGQQIMEDVVLKGLQYLKVIIAVIGILYITIMGYTLVQNGGNDEEVTKAKRGLIYALVAFLLISMSQDFGKIFDMKQGTLLGSPQEIIKRVHLFDKQAEIAITFIKYIIGAYATLMIVTSGIKLVTAGGNDEESGKAKKSLAFSVGGLLLIYVGDIFINKVFYKVDKTVYSGITGVHPYADAKAGVEQLVGITNFVVSFLGPIAVLVMIVAAIMYATAGGNDEQMQKAKRILIAAVIGIVIIFGAFAIVGTVLSGKLENIGAIT